MVYAYKDLRVVYKICFSRAIFDIQAAILVFYRYYKSVVHIFLD